jgi:hypothetical protein
MAGNPKTPKSKSGLGSASGYKRTAPSTSGVKPRVNNKNVPERSTSTAQKMMYGGTTKKKK